MFSAAHSYLDSSTSDGDASPPAGSAPGAEALVAALSEVDGPAAAHPAGIPAAVAGLTDESRPARRTVLAATVGRLVRAGDPDRARRFVELHDALAPTPDELAAHAPDYARMLAAGPATVAALAQRCLRTLEEAGRLDLELLLDSSSSALLRKEEHVVRAQLSALGRAAGRHPSRVDEIAGTIAMAFAHPAPEIQDRALTLITRHLPVLDPATVAHLAEAAAYLTGDIPARAAAVLTPARPAGVSARPEPAPGRPAAAGMPPPIAGAAALAEEVAALTVDPGAVRWERVLAGLVAVAATSDRETLARALSPLLDAYQGTFLESRWSLGDPLVALGCAIRTVLDPRRPDGIRRRLGIAVRIGWQQGRRGGADSPFAADPAGVLALRVAEVAAHLPGSMVPLLVATPTHVNGSLDPAVLLDRLTRAEAEGWQPLAFDLEQAMLRLPRTPAADREVTGRAAALTSPAGRQFARWLTTGGLPDPISATTTQTVVRSRAGEQHGSQVIGRRVVATLRPARDGGLRLERQLLTLTPPPECPPGHLAGRADVLAMVLPHHREATAAWALPGFADMSGPEPSRLLTLLTGGSGPVGPAFATALAYALGAERETDRAAAVAAVVALAAGPGPFAVTTGRALAGLCTDGAADLLRVVPSLAAAERAGAATAVWELLTAALPPLLAAPVRALPDLLEFAGRVALGLSARTPIPGLTEAASQAGSRIGREARHLQSILTS